MDRLGIYVLYIYLMYEQMNWQIDEPRQPVVLVTESLPTSR